MTQELTKKLWETYPKIFQGRHKSIKQSLIPFGFECGNGWYWLIDNLCSNLQWNTDKNNSKGDYPQVIATQVKEKFGGLCFYVEGATRDQHAIISWAESLSYHICDTCGSTKDVSQTKGWVYTECPDCRFKRENHGRRQSYLWWILISPKSGWFQRKYILNNICQKLYNKIYKPLLNIKTKLTTFKR